LRVARTKLVPAPPLWYFCLMKSAPWTVYLLRCADDTFYCGMTLDIQRRVQEHNESPRGAKYTRSRRPVELVWRHDCPDRVSAMKEELRIKRLPRKKKEELRHAHKLVTPTGASKSP